MILAPWLQMQMTHRRRKSCLYCRRNNHLWRRWDLFVFADADRNLFQVFWRFLLDRAVVQSRSKRHWRPLLVAALRQVQLVLSSWSMSRCRWKNEAYFMTWNILWRHRVDYSKSSVVTNRLTHDHSRWWSHTRTCTVADTQVSPTVVKDTSGVGHLVWVWS